MIVNTYDFSKALEMLKADIPVARLGWNGKGQSVRLQRPDENSKMNLPYFYIRTTEGNLVPWIASQSDLLASDWFTVY